MSGQNTPWLPGTPVGRYVLVSPLAAGGMAEIWLARQPGPHGFEKVVVIKRMTGALREDPEHVQMFLTEARLAAGLSHRNIVQIYELGDQDGSLYIVMEFIDGESLSRFNKRTRSLKEYVPLQMAAQLVAWAAEGLHYAHTLVGPDGKPRGIIHRDVSPQNLLVTADGNIKLVDFGIAKAAGEETMSGKLKGKLAYMPPEQARAESLDGRADVYALGVILFELATGTRLFGKMEEVELLGRLVSEQPLPRATSRRPELPVELDDIIARALSPKREDRTPSARALQVELEGWLATTSLRTSSTEIAEHLNRLFPGRAAAHHELLEAARKGDLARAQSASSVFRAYVPGSSADSAEPNSGSRSATKATALQAAQQRRRLSVAVVAVGFALLGLGAAALLAKGAAPEAPPAAQALLAKASVSVECTPKASVEIDGAVRGVTPYVADDLSPGPHELVVRAPLYREQRRTVTVKAPGEKLQLVLTLEREAVEAAAPDAGVAEAVDAGAKVEVARAAGKLNLRTTPWTTVYLGKRKLGDTPLVGVSLPAGSHQLRVVNAEAGVQSSIEVTIQPGRTTNENLVLK